MNGIRCFNEGGRWSTLSLWYGGSRMLGFRLWFGYPIPFRFEFALCLYDFWRPYLKFSLGPNVGMHRIRP